MPTYISALTLNGVPQIDLRQDTINENTASEGATGHKNDGSPFTGDIPSRTTSDLTASGATVTVPAGLYSTQATKSVASGSATAPASISGTSATVSTGTNTLTLSKSVSVTPSVTAGYISSGTAGNSSISLTASITTKAAATYTPSTQTQTIAANQYLTGAQTIGAIPSQYIIPSGNKAITENGNNIDVAAYSTVSVNVASTGKVTQAYRGYATVNSTSYTATAVKITVAKAGTYNISWMGWRSYNTTTFGSQLYKNGTAVGSANTSFLNTYGHSVSLANQTLAKDDVLTVYARSSGTTRYMAVGNLIIEEV